MIGCTWSLGIFENLRISFFRIQIPGGCLLCYLLFASYFYLLLSVETRCRMYSVHVFLYSVFDKYLYGLVRIS